MLVPQHRDRTAKNFEKLWKNRTRSVALDLKELARGFNNLLGQDGSCRREIPSEGLLHV